MYLADDSNILSDRLKSNTSIPLEEIEEEKN
jgi:hypothetical protein